MGFFTGLFFFLSAGLVAYLVGYVLSSGFSLFLEVGLYSFSVFDFSFLFVLDFYSLLFFFSVGLISGVVFYYSVFYMGGALSEVRFYLLVVLFIMSMGVLVFSSNFFCSMVGWDGLGLTSFLLVVYYDSPGSLESGLLTVFSNRLGDCFFLVSFGLVFISGLWVVDSFSAVGGAVVGLGLCVAFITKSAQVPFSSWLPAAMAAPTPVSSLVHSSTLVTAGVYLVFRYSILFESVWLSVVCLFTMVLGSVCACFEMDFKKIIAMSTLSQLGLMMYSISVGLSMLAFFHIVFHAYIKSLLFMTFGGLINLSGGSQDSRFLKGFGYVSFVGVYSFGSCLGLVGFPFLTGFYSKDVIIVSGQGALWVSYWFFVLGCLFTSVYSVRLFWFSFFLLDSGTPDIGLYEEELSWSFLTVVFLFSVWAGSLISLGFSVGLVVGGCSWLVGVLLFVFGCLLYFFLEVWGVLHEYVSGVSFLRWVSMGGLSWAPLVVSFHLVDGSWSEVWGGRGVYTLLSGWDWSSVMLSGAKAAVVLGLVVLLA